MPAIECRASWQGRPDAGVSTDRNLSLIDQHTDACAAMRPTMLSYCTPVRRLTWKESGTRHTYPSEFICVVSSIRARRIVIRLAWYTRSPLPRVGTRNLINETVPETMPILIPTRERGSRYPGLRSSAPRRLWRQAMSDTTGHRW